MSTKTQIAGEGVSYPGATSNSVAFCAMCEAAFCICGPKPRLEQNLDYNNIENQIINIIFIYLINTYTCRTSSYHKISSVNCINLCAQRFQN